METTDDVAFLPDGLARLSSERQAPLVSDGAEPFIRSTENVQRYAFALPRTVVALWEVADRFRLEDVETPSFKYLRVAPGGWEMPAAEEGEELSVTVARRFEWNTFSNMQLWEHFSGTMSLGWDPGDNRFVVATTSEEAPVFWLDHETAEMYGAVASSLERFLRAQYASGDDIGEPERTLIRKPSHWDRGDDELDYLGRAGPLTRWPPFLAARADWVVACIAFGGTEGFEDNPEARAFDLSIELPQLERIEPLALYWLARSYYLGERDVFDEARPRAAAASPLAASFARICELRWDASPETSGMARVRASVAKSAKGLRRAKWPKGMSKRDLA